MNPRQHAFSRIYNKINGIFGTSGPARWAYKHGNTGFDGLMRKMNDYFAANPGMRTEFGDELHFLNTSVKARPEAEQLIYAVMPYPFTLKMDHRLVEVFKDEDVDLFYVILDGKRLYYHRGYKEVEDVQKSFTYITAEQDPESPHRYLDHLFSIKENDVVADLGAAEGNFSLLIVDKVKEIFILESDPAWMDALHKTFEPWKDKVHIINKYAGTVVDSSMTTIEELFRDKRLDVLKMDIEGAELAVLKQSESFIRERNLRLAVTTYHRDTDADNIKVLLESSGYQTAFTDKHMLFVYDDLNPPYFRKGLITASRDEG